MASSLVVGITGGSGSGKSTLCKELVKRLGEDQVTYIPLDYYMIRNGGTNNAPEAIDFTCCNKDLDQLLSGHDVNKADNTVYKAKEIVLIEGHLIMANPELVSKLDLSIYLDLDQEERLLRRIERNVARGMELQGIIDWYRQDVKDNFTKYVEPAKKECDLILWGEITEKKLNLLISLFTTLKAQK